MKQFNKKPALAAALFSLLFALVLPARATIFPFHNSYSGAQEAPPNASTAKGTIVGTYNDVTNTISFTIIFSGLSANTTAAHFHGPAPMGVSIGVAIGHAGFPAGVTSGTYSATNILTEVQEAQLKAGLWYSNIHTVGPLAAGEIRAQIQLGDPSVISPFINTYNGAQEVPPNNSPATGMIIGSYNHASNTISYSIIFSGLTANTIAAHFHGPAAVGAGAGVAIGHAGFPTGVTQGFYTASNVLSDVQEMQLLSGLWYSNIHSAGPFSAGEIRAQILLTDILPPTISDPVATPSVLKPANHKMKNIALSYSSTDNFPGAIVCDISVSSNEPVTSASDQTSPDWIIGAGNALQLRAERLGAGSGRIYTVTVTCTDLAGNMSSKSTTVTVPHDNRPEFVRNDPAIEFAGSTIVSITPNPSRSYFAINIQNNSTEKFSLRLFDVLGRTIEARNNLSGNQVVRMGQNLKAGIYFIELHQGKESRKWKVMRLD
jgi:hypothetical protein